MLGISYHTLAAYAKSRAEAAMDGDGVRPAAQEAPDSDPIPVEVDR